MLEQAPGPSGGEALLETKISHRIWCWSHTWCYAHVWMLVWFRPCSSGFWGQPFKGVAHPVADALPSYSACAFVKNIMGSAALYTGLHLKCLTVNLNCTLTICNEFTFAIAVQGVLIDLALYTIWSLHIDISITAGVSWQYTAAINNNDHSMSLLSFEFILEKALLAVFCYYWECECDISDKQHDTSFQTAV